MKNNLYTLFESEINTVCRRMKLRRPQRDALTAFHDLYSQIPAMLKDTSNQQLLGLFRNLQPGWDYSSGFPEMTFALATGVGKTRLMGALMAYLYRTGQSQNFLILAPRTTIVDKILRELNIGDPKYIFVDQNLVAQPKVIDSSSLDSIDMQPLPFASGPTIWVFSPQAIARGTEGAALKFHKKSEYSSKSPADIISECDDLVAFFDESHHLGDQGGSDISVWRQAVWKLKPRLLFELTASPSKSANIMTSYPLQECLKDGVYTKSVRILTDKRPQGIGAWEWDKATLRQGLKRLEVKQAALNEVGSQTGRIMNDTNAVALVCAKDTEHAEQVATWLTEKLGGEAVLLVHSGLAEKKYLSPLLKVESPNSKIRVIVNVFQLTEGWDVNNVYVIIPLRSMATVTGVLQTMGRGLRLPFGSRLDLDEVDSLDVLCFGRQRMSEIVDEVVSEGFGGADDKEIYIKIEDSENIDNRLLSKEIELQPLREVRMTFPKVDSRRARINLSSLRLDARAASQPQAIDISDPRTRMRIGDATGYERKMFLNLVSNTVISRRKILGTITDQKDIKSGVDSYLSLIGLGKDDYVPYDPDIVSEFCLNSIDRLIEQTPAEYVVVDGRDEVTLKPLTIKVPESFQGKYSSSQIWHRELKHMPISDWRRCAYDACSFDSPEEFHVAKLLDQSEEVEWWIRNVREIFNLTTPAGNYSPDFLFLLNVDKENILLEVKGSHLATGYEAKAVLKARAADAWCKTVSEATGETWSHWFIIDRDAVAAKDVRDLKLAAEDWKVAQGT